MAERTIHDHGERWDATDVAALAERRARGESYATIAGAMGRTEAAVRTKLHRLAKAGRPSSPGQ